AETRGEGGQAVAPGSPLTVHETGKPYQTIARPADGRLVNEVTPEERELMLELARSFNRRVAEAPSPKKERPATAEGEVLPGEDYDVRGPDWEEILDGWQLVHQRGKDRYWRRPDKDTKGWSATTGYCKGKRGEDLLHVFSSNASPFANEKSYGKFRAYALLNHNGDLKAAIKALAKLGYGTPRNKDTGASANGQSNGKHAGH